MKHTKGPWRVIDENFEGTILIGKACPEVTDWIAQVNSGENNGMPAAITKEQALNNANLIKSAPELLAITKQLLDSLTYWLPRYGDAEILNSKLIKDAGQLINNLS